MSFPPPDTPLVSILVVAYRSHESFGRCFASLLAATRDASVEYVVVVNGVPLQPEHRSAHEAGATLLHPRVNLGLPGALHAARGLARGRYLLIVQDDVVVEPGWLEPLVATLDDDPSVGAVTSRVEREQGGLHHEGFVVWRDLKLTGLGDPGRPGPRRPVDAGGTASLLVRADAWDDVGGPYLELYPLWLVDVDLCLSLERRAWNVMVEPRSVVRHRAHTSTDPGFRNYLGRRNAPRVRRRHADVLDTRPVRDETQEAIAAQVRRCADEAERRRAAPRTASPSRPEPIPMEQLVRHARRQALEVRLGFALSRVVRLPRRLLR